MTFLLRLCGALPYFGMIAALALSTWTFVQSDLQRKETYAIWHENSTFQWRGTQARERLARVQGHLHLAAETGNAGSDFSRQMTLLNTNIVQMLQQPYHKRVLSPSQIARLKHARNAIENQLAPAAWNRSDYLEAIPYASEIEKTLLDITSAAVRFSLINEETAYSNIIASRNWHIFCITLSLIALLYLALGERLRFIYQRDRHYHLRSFASLFVHNTRSRITGLKLFLGNSQLDPIISPNMLKAARGAANELEAINQSLLTIAYPTRDLNTQPLGTLLEMVATARNGTIQLEIGAGTANLHLPSTQLQLLANELIQNAETATQSVRNRSIAITTSIKPRSIFGGARLLLEVKDNGTGMPSDIREKALAPFFSTRAGSHTGLGLTACAEMVATLKGKMTIASKVNEGTSVRLQIPILS